MTLARGLQPQNLPSLQDEHLLLAIERLEKCGVQFPTPCVLAFMRRRSSHLRAIVDAEPTSTNMDSFLDSVLPWQFVSSATYTHAKPCVRGAPLKAKVQAQFFEAQCFTKLLAPKVLGETNKFKDHLVGFGDRMQAALDAADALDLDSAVAALHSQMQDVAMSCCALQAPLLVAYAHREVLATLYDRMGKSGSSMTQVFATMVSQSKVLGPRLRLIMDALPTLEILVPRVHENTMALASMGFDNPTESAKVLKDAADTIATNRELAPEGALDDFSMAVTTQAQAFVKAFLKDAAASLAGGDDQQRDSKAYVLAVSAMVQDLSLAFPTSAWVNDLQEEVAHLMTSLDHASSNAQLRKLMLAVVDPLAASGIPHIDALASLREHLDNAVVGHSFKDSVTHEAINATVDKLGSVISEASSTREWRVVATVATKLLSFGDDTRRASSGAVVRSLGRSHRLGSCRAVGV